MVVEDEWALDPSVRMMRRVFGHIEVAQKELLKRVVGEGGELMVELSDQGAVESLSSALSERFGNQVLLSP